MEVGAGEEEKKDASVHIAETRGPWDHDEKYEREASEQGDYARTTSFEQSHAFVKMAQAVISPSMSLG